MALSKYRLITKKPVYSLLTFFFIFVYTLIGTSWDVAFVGSYIHLDPCLVTAYDVVGFMPGEKNNENPVEAGHSDPRKALFWPENDNSNNYVSLGFGGELILVAQIIPPINGNTDLYIFESSPKNKGCSDHPETVKIYISSDNENWKFLGDVCQDGLMNAADITSSKLYVRLVDTSIRDQFPGGGDGYDVDGIVIDTHCRVRPSPTFSDLATPTLSESISPTTIASATPIPSETNLPTDPNITPPTPEIKPTDTETVAPTPTETGNPIDPNTLTPTTPVPFTPTSTETIFPVNTDTLMPTAFVTYTTTPTETITPLGTDTIGPTATVTLTQTLTETVSLTASVTVIPIPSATCTITPSLTITLTPSVTDAQVTVLPPSQTPTRTFTPKPPATRSPTYFKITVLTPSATIGWIPSKATTTIPQAANTSIPSKSKTPMPLTIITQPVQARTVTNISEFDETRAPTMLGNNGMKQTDISETSMPSPSIGTHIAATISEGQLNDTETSEEDSNPGRDISFLEIVGVIAEVLGTIIVIITGILGNVLFSARQLKLPLKRYKQFIQDNEKPYLKFLFFEMFTSKYFIWVLEKNKKKVNDVKVRHEEYLFQNCLIISNLFLKTSEGKSLSYYEEQDYKQYFEVCKEIGNCIERIEDIDVRINIIKDFISTVPEELESLPIRRRFS